MPDKNNVDLHEIWVLLQVLDYLRVQRDAGRPYVPSKMLRDKMEEFVKSKNSRDDALRILKMAKAIGQVNRAGRSSVKYFLRPPVGDELIRRYREMLATK